MAITINGSGTITGITAGGYPDATVTADDLAATLDLSGKTITLPSGAGGKVVKVTSHELDNISVSTAGSWTPQTPTVANTYSVGDYNVTMTNINNYLVCSFPLLADAANTAHEIVAILDNTGSETDLLIASSYRYRRNGNDEPLGHVLTFYYTPSDISGATATTRTLSVRCHTGAATMYFGRSQGGFSGQYKTIMNVFEVAA